MADGRARSRGKYYRITVTGQLDPSWSEWFGGMKVQPPLGTEAADTTCLTGRIVDQAALHGLLVRIRDLGLDLIAVEPIDRGDAQGKEAMPHSIRPTTESLIR